MSNQPLTSGDQAKLVFFVLLMAPSVFLFVGIIPAIFLIFGIYMMKKNKDFSSIDTSVKIVKGYIWIALVGCSIASIYFGNEYLNSDASYRSLSGNAFLRITSSDSEFDASLLLLGVSFIYLIVVQVLFYSPLNRHRDWVANNGIFSTVANQQQHDNSSSIIGRDKLSSFSVADELIKWNELLEKKLISQEEFDKAKQKLMNSK